MSDETPKPASERGDDARSPKRDRAEKPASPGERRPSRDAKSGDRKPFRNDRPQREGKSFSARDGRAARDGKPAGSRDGKPYGSREGRPARDGKPYGSRDGKPYGGRDGKPGASRDGRRVVRARDDQRSAGQRPPQDERPRHDEPELPEDVTAKQLDGQARAELKTLSKENADAVARHLVMASRLIETDPELAHQHALAATRRAGRVGVVRETAAITAYAIGDFALALRELRTYRRITGRDDQLPLMVDSERGVGRPQAALELGRSVPRESLEPAVQVALAIAMSGARLDLGQPDLALVELQIPQLDPERAYSWSPALFDAYATALEELGRMEEAEQWWQRSDRATIALEQAAVPEGQDTIEVIEEYLELDEDDVPPAGQASADAEAGATE